HLIGELLAVAAEHDGQACGSAAADASATWCNLEDLRCGSCCRGCCRCGRTACATTGSTTTAATAEAEAHGRATVADRHATDVAGAHGGVPVRFHLAVLVEINAGDVDDVGIRLAGDGAVPVIEYRGLVDRVAVVVVAPAVVDRREVHRLGVDEG